MARALRCAMRPDGLSGLALRHLPAVSCFETDGLAGCAEARQQGTQRPFALKGSQIGAVTTVSSFISCPVRDTTKRFRLLTWILSRLDLAVPFCVEGYEMLRSAYPAGCPRLVCSGTCGTYTACGQWRVAGWCNQVLHA